MKVMARTIMLLLLIAGCSSSSSVVVKAWGNDRGDIEKKYPSERYIVRSGTGESPESASEAARLEIAKYFESKISGESIVRESLQSKTERGKTEEKRMTELSNIIKVSASREIPGIEIIDTQKDNKSNAYEAWAGLDKSKYAGVLSDRIMKLDSDVDQLLGNTSGDDIKRLRDLTSAMNSLVERKKAVQDLTLLKTGGAPAMRDQVLRNVIASLDSLVSTAFDVGLVWNGEIDSKVLAGLTQGIVDAGIRLKEYPGLPVAKESGADLVLSVKQDATRSKGNTTVGSKEYTIIFIDWVLSVNAMDPNTEQVIDSLVQRDKISDMGDEAHANSRMVSKILQNQVPNVSSWVYRLIFTPAEH